MGETIENFKKFTNFKIIYFLGFASLSCFQPFISIYLHSFETITPSIIGIITCLIPFLSFIAAPLWTGLADKYNSHRLVLILNCSLTIIALVLLIPTDGNLFGIFLLVGLYSLSSAPIFPIVDSFVLKQMGEDSKYYGMQRLFGAISYGIVAFVTGILIHHSLNSIFISYAFWMVLFIAYYIYNQTTMGSKLKKSGASLTNFRKLLEEEETVKESTADGSNSEDIVLEQVSENSSVNSSPSITPKSYDDDMKNNLLDKEDSSENITSIQIQEETNTLEERLTTKQVIVNLLKDAHMMIFLFAVMICGMTANIIGNYLFLFLHDVKHASSLLLGSTMPFTVVMELPFFFFGKQLLTIVGVNKMIIIGHVCFITRLCLYNILAIESISPWFVLPIEILHGIAFATIWGAGVELSNQMAPKGYETTYQGIFSGIYCGLGAGLGSIIGGFLYEHKSPMYLFRFTAIATTFSLIIFTLNQLYFSKKKKEINNCK
ncbi:hypothetical protein DICPUDRAFT_28834 [Dictyostelium purpureum]|uniref:Major facilitator superfamily associated domain-containing protein n=1 Tax=Dictyostelium purpureum TaxID=5786 RepID=F0ZCG7_DICPU|nr:uncharacterized protein DICPUDRAFT_28834 [Dictyostelium purpureum]EGC38341.1 hypothetical protein DICPUDRAFT_28834 [Dictyostelium purpureum]|eukprot:XP_003285098.1 hypothetical protein DICPUDRAFT_28834 [Dictyostelium purpureum]